MKTLLFAFILFLKVTLLMSDAKDLKTNWKFDSGLMMMSVPKYEGSSSHVVRTFPYLGAKYKDKLEIGARGISYKVSTKPYLQSNYNIGFVFPRKNIRDGWGALPYSFFVQTNQRLKWHHAFFDIQATHYLGTLAGAKQIQLSVGHGLYIPYITVFGSISLFKQWVNQQYMDVYYRIKQGDLDETFYPKKGEHQTGIGLSLIKPINKKWTLIFIQSFYKLDKQLQDSPVINHRTQRTHLLFLNYSI